MFFGAGSSSWGGAYQFAATADGTYWKALGWTYIDSISPDGARAIVVEPGFLSDTNYLTEMKWR